MVKMPDFSELKKDFSELRKKVNINSMVDNVKSAIDTVSHKTPPTSDELSLKFAEITTLMNNLSDMTIQQSKAVTHIKDKIHALDKDMKTVKALAVEIELKQPPLATSGNSDTMKVVETQKTSSGPARTDHQTQEGHGKSEHH